MLLKINQPLSYYAAETFLCVTAEELNALVDAADDMESFVAAVNAHLAALGHDVAFSHFFAAGVPSVKLWLDGVTDADSTRLGVGLFVVGHRPRHAKYFRRGCGFVAVCESHGVIA